MNRVSKAILVLCACLAAVALVAVIGVNLYVQSPGTQARIQEELRRGLRIPLRITSTSITPWGGLRISGITIPAEGANFLQATSFHAKYRLLPLLQKKLIIDSMVLERPQIVWTQGKDGKWTLPALPEPTESADEAADPPEGEIASAEAESAESQTAETEADEGKELEVAINGFEIRNGLIEMWDQEGRRVAQASGVEMVYTTMRADRLEGVLRIGQLAWKDTFYFTNVQSPFRYVDGEVSLPDIRGSLASGTVAGQFSIHPEKEGVPFDSNLTAQGVDLGRLTTEAGYPPGQASGLVAMQLALRGSSKDPDQIKGRGEVSVADAQVRQLEFFQMIGQILQIPELASLRLEQGRAEFEIRDQKAFIEDLLLQSPDLHVGAKGMLRIDGKVQLNARLGLSERLVRQLPSALRRNLEESDAAGFRSIPVKITGRLDRPKTDLLDNLVGGKIGSQFDSLVSNILDVLSSKNEKNGRKKDKDDEEPNDPAEADSQGKAVGD